ncbi:MAG: hypothetical protein AABX66_02540 [Nanoarchaeota archaeon]
MGFWEGIKKVWQEVTKGVSKLIKTAQIENKLHNEAYQNKRRILMNLGISDLKNLSYLLGLKLEYEQYMEEGSFVMKERKIKLNKFDYVDRLAKTPYAELVLKLRHLHKSVLADEMERDISFLENKMNEEKEIITQEILPEQQKIKRDTLLSTFVKTIINEIISINPEKCRKEHDYQTELKGVLKGSIKKEFPKSNVSVDTEYKTKTGRRFDIMIQIDNYKIGVETKTNMSSSAQFQRVKGQILEYSEFADALILVQKEPLEDKVGLENLKQVSRLMSIPFNVVANGNVKI